MSELDELNAQIILGDRVDAFFRDDIGRYVIGVAKQEEDAAVEQLKTVDPADEKKIRELQVNIKIAKAAITWLNEAIIMAREAEQQLDQIDD